MAFTLSFGNSILPDVSLKSILTPICKKKVSGEIKLTVVQFLQRVHVSYILLVNE